MPQNARIAEWQRILDGNHHGPHHATAKDRLRTCICSLSLGRDFMEDPEAYIDRAGHREFHDWAVAQLDS